MIKRILLTIVCLLILTVVVLHSPLVAAFEFLADFDTEVITGFSYENFEKVQIGMSQDQVLGIMGKPFEGEFVDKCFHYSQVKPMNQRIQRYGDINWHDLRVCFGEDETVSFKSNNIFFN